MLCDGVSEGDLFRACGLSIENVCAEPERLVGLKMSQKVILIDNCTARGIKQNTIWLHVAQEIFIYHILSLSCGRGVNADKITSLEKVMKIGGILESKLLLEAWVLGAIVDKNIQIESLCSFENKLSDSTKTDKTKSAALDSCAISEHSLVPLLLSKKLDTLGNSAIN